MRRGQDTRKREQSVQRSARRTLEQAEAEVTRADAEVQRLQAALADPELYLTGDGVRRAAALGRDLEAAQRALETAFAAWGTLSGEG